MKNATQSRGGPVTEIRQALRLMTLTAPLHPILVHFTVALMIASLGADTIGYFFSAASLAHAGWWTMVGSLAVTPLTLVTGAISRGRIPIEEGPARSFLRSHMALGPVVFGLLVAMTIWRAVFWEHSEFVSGWYLLGVYGAGLIMTIQGYLGGEIVYRYGAEVKRAYREMPGRPTQSLPPLLISSSRISTSVQEAIKATREGAE